MDEHWRIRAREYNKNLDRRYQGRVNYILVAESMLLLSYVTANIYSTINKTNIRNATAAIAITGIVITICWIIVNIRLSLQIRSLQKYLKPDSVFKHLIDSVRQQPSAILLLTYILPTTIFSLWIYLIGFAIWEIKISLYLCSWLVFIIDLFILIELGIKLYFVSRKCETCGHIYLYEEECPYCVIVLKV